MSYILIFGHTSPQQAWKGLRKDEELPLPIIVIWHQLLMSTWVFSGGTNISCCYVVLLLPEVSYCYHVSSHTRLINQWCYTTSNTTTFAIVGFISMGLHKLRKVGRTCATSNIPYGLTFRVRWSTMHWSYHLLPFYSIEQSLLCL